MKLSPQQEIAFDAIMKWHKGDIQGKAYLYDGYSDAHKKLQRFDFAYAITCHKAQGSEFDNCLVYNEPIGKDEMHRRWLYTAITRSKNNVTLVDP